jgi:hypothetical protein
METHFTSSCRQFLDDSCRRLWEYSPACVRLTTTSSFYSIATSGRFIDSLNISEELGQITWELLLFGVFLKDGFPIRPDDALIGF